MANKKKKAWKKVDEGWESVLTRQQALEIKKLRKRGTWRGVAARFAENHSDLGVCNGNQIDGMLLCEAAAKILNQKWN